MARQRKRIREKGKLRLSQYFKEISEGTNVAVVTDVGAKAMFPKRLKGLNGKVIGSRGKFKLVQIKTGNKMKTFIIHPIHLRVLNDN
ncbi:50S ribosomal protein L21e [Candidatus Pacearchaeota archaeon]|nr:50S ribosomal protein L21e [Candidatus Pacearchaeota archaeon]